MVKKREKKVTCFRAERMFSVIQSQEQVADGWWASCPRIMAADWRRQAGPLHLSPGSSARLAGPLEGS